MAGETTNAAIIFDFDDTLLPDSTTALIARMGIDAGEFWKQTVNAKVKDGWDPTLAWMDEIVRGSQPGGPFDGVTQESLIEHGADIASMLFPGVKGMADELRIFAEDHGVVLSAFVVSSGLTEVIAACNPVGGAVDDLFGCTFAYGEDGRPVGIKSALTFTEKTRCVFEISKGISSTEHASSPYAVNRRQEEPVIPISNMIYLGDGLTDVPAFSLVRQHGGTPIGVAKSEPLPGVPNLVQDNRVDAFEKPDYRPGQPMRQRIEAAIEQLANPLISKWAV